MGFYTDKKILVTGATGTIGRHLVNRLLRDRPKVIRVYSRDEFKQYEMSLDLAENAKQMRYLIGDVRDLQRLSRAMEDIDYVFHLAAMKHVPFCEYNPFEAVQTNVIGTQNVIQAAIQNTVQKVLFTSTDKAISPTNTYGATKLMGERLISAAEHQKGPSRTILSSVRFGNVMGSRGSVIPLFIRQIRSGKRITITDPSMVRYMMTPGQAIDLILKANELAQGGEVFVLKMPIVRITDLAEIVIEETKKRYGIQESIKIETIGIRPGEKRYEELMSDEEKVDAIETDEMYILGSIYNKKADWDKFGRHYDESSEYQEAIGKEVLRDWLLTENLIQ
ncbi:UDP-N-acetylglucosamine 4,6-dehydratase family protein [Cohnella caldifontis]|uniref:UDP-N-acetylglucosamine 4,6-dehydratase family protein n=1 Tax=Cohnella caldifontis TaxID=3027471 RepID=UPI0023ED4D9D|nr:UDP-N-acetylglucosamine 4,6-dehydratase family protein [Cohnella sp. YIM B05605]